MRIQENCLNLKMVPMMTETIRLQMKILILHVFISQTVRIEKVIPQHYFIMHLYNGTVNMCNQSNNYTYLASLYLHNVYFRC